MPKIIWRGKNRYSCQKRNMLFYPDAEYSVTDRNLAYLISVRAPNEIEQVKEAKKPVGRPSKKEDKKVETATTNVGTTAKGKPTKSKK